MDAIAPPPFPVHLLCACKPQCLLLRLPCMDGIRVCVDWVGVLAVAQRERKKNYDVNEYYRDVLGQVRCCCAVVLARLANLRA
jgi:hypothetical protein